MFAIIKNFHNETDGAVTVDFVVLTAAICTLGLVVVLSFAGSTTSFANEISLTLNNIEL